MCEKEMELQDKSQISELSIRKKTKRWNLSAMSVLVLLLLLTVFVSLAIGRYRISLQQFIQIVGVKIFGWRLSIPQTLNTVIFSVRVPRIFAAMLVGGALSISGAAYQGLFRNPMVSPDILGAAAGAGFGAAIAILFSFSVVGIQLSAFVFGLIAVAITYFLSAMISRGNHAVLVLVLTGMVVSTLFSSFISMIKYVADPYSKLPAITFWLMGGLSSVGAKDNLVVLVPMLLGAIPLMLLRWKLNVLSFGEEEAKSLGVDTSKLRLVVVVCSTLLTAAAVSISGMVGWIGLIIPHLARMIVGPNYKMLLPASMLIGTTFLLLVDDVARSAFAMEIPLGILTALIGAPFFIYLLIKGKKGWL